MTQSFELVWTEYKEFCKKECGDNRECVEDVDAELDSVRPDYMHFFDFLRWREEIGPEQIKKE